MSDLAGQFTREDIETLIEAMGDWEMLGNHEFHVMQMIKGAPMPPEDHEAFEVMQQIKDHYRKREKDIKMHREVRQEKAVFLKAKLMLVRKDLGINALFDMSINTDPNSPMPAPKEERQEKKVKIDAKSEKPKESNGNGSKLAPTGSLRKRIAWAEFFIKDLGVWDHYQKFLKEKQEEEESQEESQE